MKPNKLMFESGKDETVKEIANRIKYFITFNCVIIFVSFTIYILLSYPLTSLFLLVPAILCFLVLLITNTETCFLIASLLVPREIYKLSFLPMLEEYLVKKQSRTKFNENTYVIEITYSMACLYMVFWVWLAYPIKKMIRYFTSYHA